MGHGVMLMPNGANALSSLGLSNILKGFHSIEQVILQDNDGLVIHSEAVTGIWCATRSQLVDSLRTHVPADMISYERRCIRVELEDGRFREAHFEAGPPLTASGSDLVIGAEGTRSPTRRALNPGLSTKVCQVNELVTSSHQPRLAEALGSRFIKTHFPGRGVALGMLASSANSVIAFLQFDSKRYPQPNRDSVSLKAFSERLLVGAPEPVRSWMVDVRWEGAHLWRPTDIPVPPILHGVNVALVGDAGHPLLPFSSQGVGAALEDAVALGSTLSDCRGGSAALSRSLVHYASSRRPTLESYQRGGHRLLENFLDPAADFTMPYVTHAAERIAKQIRLGPGGLFRIFRVLDSDADGYLGVEELQEFLEIAGLPGGPETAQALLVCMDNNGDGRVQVDELIVALGGDADVDPLIRSLREALAALSVDEFSARARARSLFTRLDTNGDGAIDRGEWSSALFLSGLVLPDASVWARFDALDSDRDGLLQLNELTTALSADHPALDGLEFEDPRPDPWFDDSQVDRATLRRRAYNHRWAVHPPDVIPLTAADLDFPVAEAITDAIRTYVEPGLLSYGPPEGLPEFLEVGADHLRSRGHLNVQPDHLLAANSAASALYLVARAALTSPGQEALIFDPVDFLFERSVAAAGGQVVRIPLAKDGWTFDPEFVESLIVPGKTRLLGVCNPHNPCGRVWTRDELQALADIAVRHDLWILSDEVWADIVYAPHQHTAIASLSDEVAARTYTVYGFSKGYGLAGLRVGLIACPDRDARNRLVHLSHADETAYGVSTLSQVAAMAAWRDAGDWLARFVAHLESQRDYALSRLNAMPGVHCQAPQGTFVMFPDVSSYGLDTEDMVRDLLHEHRVALVPGSPRFFGPGALGHVRIAFATSRDVLREGLDRLEVGLAVMRGRSEGLR